jgi:hypothetical protein
MVAVSFVFRFEFAAIDHFKFGGIAHSDLYSSR